MPSILNYLNKYDTVIELLLKMYPTYNTRFSDHIIRKIFFFIFVHKLTFHLYNDMFYAHFIRCIPATLNTRKN